MNAKKILALMLGAMMLLSLFLDAFPMFAITEDLLLATILGGGILGVGLALVLMGNATTGGTDLASAMIQRLLPHVSFGMILLIIEILIVSFSGLVFGVHLALYAAVSLFLTSRIVDMLQEGVASSRLFFIISPRAIASICCSPPERLPPFCRMRSFRRGNSSKFSSMSCLICFLVSDLLPNVPVMRFS